MPEPTLTPTEFLCRCGSRVMDRDTTTIYKPLLMKRDKATNKMVEMKCPCGGQFKPVRPLLVYNMQPAPPVAGQVLTMRIACRPCKKDYRRVVPTRYSCPSCNETAVVHGTQLWFFASADVAVDYEAGGA